MKNEELKKVFESLLHPKYQWRTIKGIAKQTKLSQDDVKKSLDMLIKKKEVRKAHVADVRGNDLYGLISRVNMDLDRL
jgi:predicted transcriptional regulator